MEEESNGLSDEKQVTEEEPATEASMEVNQTEEQETMDTSTEDVEFKENKEKEMKENVRLFLVALHYVYSLRHVEVQLVQMLNWEL